MPITVIHTELANSGSESYSRDGKDTVTRRLMCDWNDRDTLRAQLMGGTVRIGSALQSWVVPDQHPTRKHLYVKGVRIEGYGVPGQDANNPNQITFSKAILEVEYGSLDLNEQQKQENPTVTYLTESAQIAAEVLTIPGDLVRWGSDPPVGLAVGDPVNGSETTAALRYPKLIWTITIHQWINPPLGEDSPLQEYVGCVNKSPYGPLWRKFKKETLLYNGCNLERDYTNQPIIDQTTGRALDVSEPAYRVTLNFEWQKHGWNKMLAKDGKFHLVTDSTSDPIYESKDFKRLLP